MATYAHRVWQNFGYRISAITPTASDGYLRTRFYEVDPLQQEDDVIESRGYWVDWNGADDDDEPTDLTDRWNATHKFIVNVHYNTANQKISTVYAQIFQDRHDLIKRLRDPAYWVGYDSSNTSTDIGLQSRIVTGTDITRAPEGWTLRLSCTCLIEENE